MMAFWLQSFHWVRSYWLVELELELERICTMPGLITPIAPQ